MKTNINVTTLILPHCLLVLAAGAYLASCNTPATIPGGEVTTTPPTTTRVVIPATPEQCRTQRHQGAAAPHLCSAQGMKDVLNLDDESTYADGMPVNSMLNAWKQENASATLGGFKGAISLASQWPNGSTLKVWFFNDPYGLRKRVISKANEWNSAGANLVFVESPSLADSHIRVTFLGTGYWSYIGTTANRFKSSPTMSLSFVSNPSNGDFNSTVLHEFGHAIGLVHEHQQPHSTIKWNEQAVYNYYIGPPNCWKPDQIRDNVLRRLPAAGLKATDHDTKSIMQYAVPNEHTLDGKGIPWNYDLSATDKEFISACYPKNS